MLQERQIVNDLGNQIDIEDIVYSKYAVVSFQPIYNLDVHICHCYHI
jgi:hypothetical protein